MPEAESALRQVLAQVGGLPLAGHQDPVEAVAFHPDSGSLVTADRAGRLQVWAAKNQDPEKLGEADTGAWVTALAFNLDSGSLASGHWDGSVRFWPAGDSPALPLDLDHPAVLERSPLEREVPVLSLAFSPQGDRLAVAFQDGRIDLWQRDPGAEVPFRFERWREVSQSSNSIDRLAFGPLGLGSELLIADRSAGVLVWDLADAGAPGALTLLDDLGGDGANDLAFYGDGSALAVAGDRLLRTWSYDPTEGLVEPRDLDFGAYRLAASRTGVSVAFSAGDRSSPLSVARRTIGLALGRRSR